MNHSENTLSEILLVEDNITDAKLAIVALHNASISNPVVNLRDGDEALEYIFQFKDVIKEELKKLPLAIILDLKMPKVNGKEVLRRVKLDDRTKDIPVIVFSSSQEESDVVECYNIGVNSYVVKPIEFDKFEDVVKEIGNYWLMVNHPVS